MLSQLNYKAAAHLNGGTVAPRRPLGAHSFYTPAQLFETADGHLALFVTHDGFWRRLCVEIGHAEWADDPRFATMAARAANRTEVVSGLAAVLAQAPAAEWVARLRPLGLAVGEVVELADALDGDLERSRGMVVSVDTPDGPLRLVGNPIRIDGADAPDRPPPRLHEHTAELLAPQQAPPPNVSP